MRGPSARGLPLLPPLPSSPSFLSPFFLPFPHPSLFIISSHPSAFTPYRSYPLFSAPPTRPRHEAASTIQLRGVRSAASSPVGSGAEPRPQRNFCDILNTGNVFDVSIVDCAGGRSRDPCRPLSKSASITLTLNT